MRLKLFLYFSCCLFSRIESASALDYEREIKPLLAKQCVQCHGASQQKGGLRLDTADGALRGGKQGASVRPGHSSESPLIHSVLGSSSETDRMPYKRAPLDSAEILRLRAWIDSGAPHPENEMPSSDRHWAFIPPNAGPLPSHLPSGAVVRTPIDRFILGQLQQHQLQFSREASGETLLRRVALDLTGLPPTPDEMAAFKSDVAPGAYERAVERYLASPHYGERWGRWWLDAARYADSNGYSIDSPRSMWPYRDWVIRAFNQDLPFDRFTLLQLAGDLIPGATPSEQLENQLATGFHRNTQVNHEGGVDPEQFRIESVIDRVNTTATVWLGITLGCAQCHDHKFDPFTMRDYYQFLAYFNSTENDGHGNAALEAVNKVEIGSEEELATLVQYKTRLGQLESELQSWIDSDLKPRLPIWEANLTLEARQKLKPEIQSSLDVSPGLRNEFQRSTVLNAFRDTDSGYQKRRVEMDNFRKMEPSLATSLVMRELSLPRPTRIFVKGDFTRPGEPVTPSTPSNLPALKSSSASPNRLDLARWLVSRDNPLTARVLVNRVWQQYFGKGIVETENDFGTQGASPTNPELLDWLAVSLVNEGWSLKKLHQQIVTSSTYRQTSRVCKIDDSGVPSNPMLDRALEIDPLNHLLWRQNRLRLDAEIIRDTQLANCGLLDPTLGGAPVFPPQPTGLDAFTQNKREWKTSTGGARYRRAIYTHIQRTTFHPALSVFDAADGYFTCTRRNRSNTPLQALTLLNDPAFAEFAAMLGKNLQRPNVSDADRISRGFALCVGRSPSKTEMQTLLQLLESERQATQDSRAAWISVARVLLNLDETITRE